MRLSDSIKLALQNLWRTRFRSFLTVLGVVIGISAIVAFVSLGVGLQKITADQVVGMSALTTLTVSQTPATSTMEEGPNLNDQVIDKISKLKGVVAVTPSVSLPANVSSSGTSAGAIVYGINVSNIDLEVAGLDHGKPIENSSSNEAIISSALASAFDSNHDNVLGKEIVVKLLSDSGSGINYQSIEIALKIVGIDSNETTNLVYVPIGKIYDTVKFDKYTTLKVKVDTRKSVDLVNSQIKGMGYQVTTIKDLIDQIDKIFLLIQIVLGLIGGIGLLVSSLGIINTMTISLLERTHEIGIMKAIGASNKSIRRLFMLESAFIGLFGGLLGIGLAVGFGELFNFVLNKLISSSGQYLEVFITPVDFALVMLGVAILISVLAGIYPTTRAQRLVPIDALRQ